MTPADLALHFLAQRTLPEISMVHLIRQLPLTAAALVIASSMPLGAQEKDELQKCDKPFGPSPSTSRSRST